MLHNTLKYLLRFETAEMKVKRWQTTITFVLSAKFAEVIVHTYSCQESNFLYYSPTQVNFHFFYLLFCSSVAKGAYYLQ